MWLYPFHLVICIYIEIKNQGSLKCLTSLGFVELDLCFGMSAHLLIYYCTSICSKSGSYYICEVCGMHLSMILDYHDYVH